MDPVHGWPVGSRYSLGSVWTRCARTDVFPGRRGLRTARLSRVTDGELSKGAHTAVLVEGSSDREAVKALARRLDRDLPTEGIAVVAMGGATNVGQFVRRLGPMGTGLRLTGLCDQAETGYFERALDEAGLLDPGTPLQAAGFFVCVVDLEDELIRAIGLDGMLDFLQDLGDLRRFQVMQRQPAQRERTLEQQIHRFVGVRSGRKERYAAALVDALDIASVPRPLHDLIHAV